MGKPKERKPQMDLALLRLVHPERQYDAPPETDHVGDCYAHFADTLEAKIKEELTETIHQKCLNAACEAFGISPSEETHKIPEVMFQTLFLAKQQGHECAMLKDLVRAIWRYFCKQEIEETRPARALRDLPVPA